MEKLVNYYLYREDSEAQAFTIKVEDLSNGNCAYFGIEKDECPFCITNEKSFSDVSFIQEKSRQIDIKNVLFYIDKAGFNKVRVSVLDFIIRGIPLDILPFSTVMIKPKNHEAVVRNVSSDGNRIFVIEVIDGKLSDKYTCYLREQVEVINRKLKHAVYKYKVSK